MISAFFGIPCGKWTSERDIYLFIFYWQWLYKYNWSLSWDLTKLQCTCTYIRTWSFITFKSTHAFIHNNIILVVNVFPSHQVHLLLLCNVTLVAMAMLWYCQWCRSRTLNSHKNVWDIFTTHDVTFALFSLRSHTFSFLTVIIREGEMRKRKGKENEKQNKNKGTKFVGGRRRYNSNSASDSNTLLLTVMQ